MYNTSAVMIAVVITIIITVIKIIIILILLYGRVCVDVTGSGSSGGARRG